MSESEDMPDIDQVVEDAARATIIRVARRLQGDHSSSTLLDVRTLSEAHELYNRARCARERWHEAVLGSLMSIDAKLEALEPIARDVARLAHALDEERTTVGSIHFKVGTPTLEP